MTERRARVELATNLAPEKAESRGRFFNAFTRKTTVENLRISFKVIKSLKSQPNTCELTVYNLAEGRKSFQTLPAHVTLSAGYGEGLKQLFKGDVLPGGASSRREGPTWMTHVQAGTGATAHKRSRVSRTFRAGGDFKSVLKELAAANGVKLPSNVDEAREFIGSLATGVTLSGPTDREMARILRSKGFSHSIQDDQLQIIKDGDVSRARAIVCSEETGMIGSPELGAPEEKGKPPVLSVRMYLTPEITPGGLIKVNSRDILGSFKVLRVIHTGDTRGPSWYSDVEAVAL